MQYPHFLNSVVEKGIAAAKGSYTRPEQEKKLRGSIAGFEACRHQNPQQLKDLLAAAHTASEDAHKNNHEEYWWFRTYELEVEWVCNVVSVLMHHLGLTPIITPTVRAAVAAQKILSENPVATPELEWLEGAHGCQQAKHNDVLLTVEREGKGWVWFVHGGRGKCLANGASKDEAGAKQAATEAGKFWF